MEIALDAEIPTYAGGLGILAGDTLRAGADLKLPICAVSLLHQKGYFRQRLDESGWQIEEEDPWEIEKYLTPMDAKVKVSLEGREVWIRCWRYLIEGQAKESIPVYLLDTDVEGNSEWDRHLTDRLYLGDNHLRTCQEAVLGIGGVRMLRALGHDQLARFHMNEGHSAFLGLELLDEEMALQGAQEIDDEMLQAVRKKCVFTTHTPVPAGHDQFPLAMARKVLGDHEAFFKRKDLFEPMKYASDCLNMTYLALNLSHYVNGVAKRHAEVSRLMFADHEIDSITNGVHART